MIVEISCPLGHTCEEAVTGKILRCAWYVEMAGTDASGESHDEWKCAMAWQPILQVEMSGTNRGQTEALETMRAEQVKGHNEFMVALTQAKNRKMIGNGESH